MRCSLSRTNAVIERFVFRHDPFGGESLLGDRLTGPAELQAPWRVASQCLDRCGELCDFAKGDKLTGSIVVDDFRNTANAHGHTGAPEAHGLKDTETKALAFRGDQVQVGCLQVFLDVLDFV